MKKTFWILSLSVLFGCIALGLVLRGRLLRTKPRIVVLTKDSPFFNQVTSGIEAGVAKYFKNGCDIRYFYGKGMDKIQFQTMVEEAFMEQPDLIIPIGVTFSQLCISTAQRRRAMIPIIFAGPGEPLSQGLVSSLGTRPELVTGVSLSAIDYLEPARRLLACKPSVKNILIPYNPTASAGALSEIVRQLISFFKDHQITVISLPIYTIGETKELVTAFMDKIDVVMCLEGDTIADVTDVLVKLCNQYHVTLFAKDMECVVQGASLGFGVEASIIGEQVMAYSDDILNKKTEAGRLPIYFVDGARKMALNKNAAPKQGLQIDQRLLSLVDKVY